MLVRDRIDAAILDLNLNGDMASEFVARLVATRLPCLIVSGYSEEALPAMIGEVPRLEKPVSAVDVVKALETELAAVS